MSTVKPGKGAALEFAEKTLGGPLVEVESYPSIGSTGASVAANANGDRVGLLMMNVGATDCYVAIQALTGGQTGFFLPANGGALSLNVRDDFTLPSRNWFGRVAGGTT